MKKKKFVPILIVGVIVLVVIIIFSSATFVIIQPGERGVLFKPWTSGLNKDKIYSEGVHIVAPWNKLEIFNVREQSLEFSNEDTNHGTLDVLDKNGLSIQVEVTIRFYPVYEKIGYLYEKFGSGDKYVDILIIPEVRSAVRKIMGRYTAEEIYSTKRTELEEQIILETSTILAANNITMTALLIRSIQIPADLKTAIETKQTKQQEALAYDYILQKEVKEKERKITEAEGIAAYNNIINNSMTDKILTYEGIQATLELANSQNSKIIIIGSGDNGMPIILNGDN